MHSIIMILPQVKLKPPLQVLFKKCQHQHLSVVQQFHKRNQPPPPPVSIMYMYNIFYVYTPVAIIMLLVFMQHKCFTWNVYKLHVIHVHVSILKCTLMYDQVVYIKGALPHNTVYVLLYMYPTCRFQPQQLSLIEKADVSTTIL